MATVRVGDIDIYYEEHGDSGAEPVLLIPGFAGNATAWGPQTAALAERYRVIPFDNRGVGRTTQPDGDYSIPQMAGDAAGLLDALGIDSAHVMGQSMGGMIAQELAIRHPERVRSLVLMCTTPGGPRSFGHDRLVALSAEARDVDDLAKLITPESLQQSLDELFTREFQQDAGDVFTPIMLVTIQHPQTLAGFKGQLAAVLAHDTLDRLQQITAPTLVITGGDDPLVDPRNSTLLAEHIPGAQLEVVEGLRHGFSIERPDLVNPRLLEFLAEHAAVLA